MATQSQLATPQSFSLTGCRPISVASLEIADYEGPVEYWDAETELVWELSETSLYHEAPRVRLIAMVNDIGKMRGMPISACGTTDLQERDANNQRTRIAQADETIYLDAAQVPVGPVIIVGKSPLPDVVLEVDLTTDIRDRKLELYACWGVPELWVEVPDARLPSKRKRPGLTIHTLKNKQYQQVAESTAFPYLASQRDSCRIERAVFVVDHGWRGASGRPHHGRTERDRAGERPLSSRRNAA